MESKIQVDHTYYANPKYGSMERFISYQHQIAAIRDSGVKNILLVGVGDGLVPFYLQHVLGIAVTTCDIDPALKPDIVGDIKKLPCADESFDAVAVFEVLEHLPYEDFTTCLAEINRVSRKEVFISIPYRNTGMDLLFKFPFIRTLIKREWLRLLITWPIKFPGFEISGQHYWEISTQTPKKKVHTDVEQFFDIIKKEHVVFDVYRYFLTLRKKESLSNQYTQEYYDNYLQQLPDDYKTSRWFATPAHRFDFEQTKKVILNALKNIHVERTLEIGPGDGVWTDLVVPHTNRLTLLDQSEEMLKRAKKRLVAYSDIAYEHTDFASYESVESYSMIFGIRCFEYFDDKALALRKCNQLLQPGGTLIIVTKNPEHVRNQNIQKKSLHKGQISRKEMHALLEQEGFKVTQSLSAIFRIKSTFAPLRLFAKVVHSVHVATGGWITIPWLNNAFTESYIYVARKQ